MVKTKTKLKGNSILDFIVCEAINLSIWLPKFDTHSMFFNFPVSSGKFLVTLNDGDTVVRGVKNGSLVAP